MNLKFYIIEYSIACFLPYAIRHKLYSGLRQKIDHIAKSPSKKNITDIYLEKEHPMSEDKQDENESEKGGI